MEELVTSRKAPRRPAMSRGTLEREKPIGEHGDKQNIDENKGKRNLWPRRSHAKLQGIGTTMIGLRNREIERGVVRACEQRPKNIGRASAGSFIGQTGQ